MLKLMLILMIVVIEVLMRKVRCQHSIAKKMMLLTTWMNQKGIDLVVVRNQIHNIRFLFRDSNKDKLIYHIYHLYHMNI